MQCTLDQMCRVVLPKALRERCALKSGDHPEVTVEADGIRLRPVAAESPPADESGTLVGSSEAPPSVWVVGAFLHEQRGARS